MGMKYEEEKAGDIMASIRVIHSDRIKEEEAKRAEQPQKQLIADKQVKQKEFEMTTVGTIIRIAELKPLTEETTGDYAANEDSGKKKKKKKHKEKVEEAEAGEKSEKKQKNKKKKKEKKDEKSFENEQTLRIVARLQQLTAEEKTSAEEILKNNPALDEEVGDKKKKKKKKEATAAKDDEVGDKKKKKKKDKESEAGEKKKKKKEKKHIKQDEEFFENKKRVRFADLQNLVKEAEPSAVEAMKNDAANGKKKKKKEKKHIKEGEEFFENKKRVRFAELQNFGKEAEPSSAEEEMKNNGEK